MLRPAPRYPGASSRLGSGLGSQLPVGSGLGSQLPVGSAAPRLTGGGEPGPGGLDRTFNNLIPTVTHKCTLCPRRVFFFYET